MLNKLYHLFYYTLSLLLICCASQAPPSGGPIDFEAPSIFSIEPDINNGILSNKDKIVITFNELLNPKSLVNSVNIYPEIEINISIKNNKIIIEPLYQWPNDIPINITVNRSLSDYNSNSINETIQLFYNGISSENLYSISGNLFNSNEGFLQIALYEWPVSFKEDSPYKLVQSNKDGSYKFKYIKSGKYVIFVTQDKTINPTYNIRNNYYGLSNSNYIEVTNTDYQEDIYIDIPLIRNKIEEIQYNNINYYKLLISNGEIVEYFLDKKAQAGDTISFSINMQNQLENYPIDVDQYIIPNIEDTISPSIISEYIYKDSLFIEFSEPIIKDSLIIYNTINNNKLVDHIFITPKKIFIKQNNVEELILYRANVLDFSNNYMLDSLRKISFTFGSNEYEKTLLSTINGVVNTKYDNKIVVQAINLDSEQTYSTVNNIDNFKFEDVLPGNYIIWAYFMENPIDSLRYFSGTINPYKSSSRFIFLKDTIEVRRNWDIEGLIINFY